MNEGESENEAAALRRLIELAQERTRRNRRVVTDNVADLFLSQEGRLSEHERALIGAILNRLLADIEARLRREFAGWFARLDPPPGALVTLLGQAETELARPIVARSPVLRDSQLIEIVKRRSQEHLLVTALRQPLPPEVVEAIADKGDENAVERLLKGPDPVLSRRALEYLVAESQRIDRFQQPVLNPDDLPPELARRLYWWVAAALRHAILSSEQADSAALDDCIEETTRAAIGDGADASIDRKAARLVEGLVDAQELGERFLVQCLRGGKMTLFVAGFARLARLDCHVVRRILFDPGYEMLAIVCRAIGLERMTLAAIHVLAHQGAGQPDAVASLREALKLFDGATPVRARAVLRHLRADPDYLDAVSSIVVVGRP